MVNALRVLFMRQVNNFAVAVPSARIANLLFDMIDEQITFPLKPMDLVTLFNGIDIDQTGDYIKISCETYLDRIMEKYLDSPVNLQLDDMSKVKPTPLPNRPTFQKYFLTATGDPDPNIQLALTKEMGFRYRNAIGELIYAMVTCRPDLSYAVVRSSQYSSCPAAIHYHGVRHILKYLFLTKNYGIYFWRQTTNVQLPQKSPPNVNSNLHDLLMNGQPKNNPNRIAAWVDSDWAGYPRTRRSFTGTCLQLAGGTVAYKSCQW